MTYVFYDLETSGLEKPFDQVFQFGAIYTDTNLNVIDTIDVRCNRLSEVVPSPKALIVTRVSPKDISTQKLSHYEMMRLVSSWITDRSPATFIGHNSIDFDEKFLRYGLYKSLHGPYLTSSIGSKRSDTMLMCHATFHHDTKNLTPAYNGEKMTFRLGPIARANGIEFSEETAHDAMADIQATLDLAKHIRDNAPDVWSAMSSNSSAEGVISFLTDNDYCFLSAVYFGKPYSYVVCKASVSVENDKEIALFDLSNDPEDFLKMEVYELVSALSSRKKPFRIIKANNSPILFPKSMPSSYVKGDLLSAEVYEERANKINGNAEFQQRLAEAIPQRYTASDPAEHVEDRLYEGFYQEDDYTKMELFHNSPWEEKQTIVNSFLDSRLREIGNRILCEEAPEYADPKILDNYKKWVEYRLTTKDTVSWTTIDKALTELADISSPENADLSEKIHEFLIGLSVEVL